jgi:methylated-DNA-[protein]-cysteine S-methyltransferase
MEDMYFFWLIPSSHGEIGLVWAGFGKNLQIHRILLSEPQHPSGETVKALYPRAVPAVRGDLPEVAVKIEACLAGQNVSFSLADLGEKGIMENRVFRRRVLLQAMAIPRGMVDSYGGLAAKAGNPKAARAVGTAMATNPFPLVVPCHRLVRSDGAIGQFGGGAPMKKELLTMEGALFDSRGRVLAECFYR